MINLRTNSQLSSALKAIGVGPVAALALAACGSSGPKPPCMVLKHGNKLCGNAAVTWCELNNVGLDYPSNSSTAQACRAASNWQDRGKKVINISPNADGTGPERDHDDSAMNS